MVVVACLLARDTESVQWKSLTLMSCDGVLDVQAIHALAIPFTQFEYATMMSYGPLKLDEKN